ncbi:hypothetical protein V4B17_02500 [Bartonella sp. B23]
MSTVQDINDTEKQVNAKDEKHKINNGFVAGMKGYNIYSKGKEFFNWATGNTGEI